MRQIGHIEDERPARLFGDYLYVQGVENEVEPEAGHGWVIWIRAEEDVERATRLLGEFRADPKHPRFAAQAAAAGELREQARRDALAHAKKVKSGQQVFNPLYKYGFAPVTLVLMLISIGVFCWSKFGTDPQSIYKLFISVYMRGLPEIRHGEVWRLFTPMFIHFGFPHIFFNLIALREMGSAIESRLGSKYFLKLVLVIAALSNLAQFFIESPAFGGMSGVVYGLLGFIWMRGKYDLTSGLFAPPMSVVIMVVWFFLCFLGYIPGVANYAHGAGLLLGMAWGYLSALRKR